MKNDKNYQKLSEIFSKQKASDVLNQDVENSGLGDDIKGKTTNTFNRQNNASGSLDHKTVWISPDHGWLWNSGLNTYLTQRGNTNGMVKDFGSIENVNQYLQQYLKNAGANNGFYQSRSA